MIKLIKEYLQTGIDCYLQTTAAQKVVSEAFLLNLELLKGNIKAQNTEHFRERERVFDRFKTLNKKRKRSEIEEKELLNLINYIDKLVE